MSDEAAAILARKKRSRSGHKASTIRLLNLATTALREEVIDTDELALLNQRIADKAEILKALDNELANLVPDEELEEEIQQADEYLEGVHRVLGKLKKSLGTTTGTLPPAAAPVVPRSSTTSPTAETGLVHSGAVTERGPTVAGIGTERTDILRREPPSEATPAFAPSSDRVKLPKISLPHFRGSYMKWTAFWDCFESAVHRNHHLSEIEKFTYLRSLLEGAAYDAIAGLSLSAANYAETVQILKRRFGNKQLIISRHMEDLLDTTAVTSDHHLRDLRRLYDRSESNIRSFKALGVEPESYVAMLSPILLSKLPPDLRLIVSRKVQAEDLNMESILELFEQELLARERAINPVQQHGRRAQSLSQNYEPSQARSSTSAFIATTQRFSGKTNCAFCHGSHPSVTCESVTDIEGRKRILRNSGRCYNCLRKNHLSRNCHSSSKCSNCQGRHHTSICEKGTPLKGVSTTKEFSRLDPEAPSFTTNTTTNTLCSTQGRAILLQTARTVAYNPAKPKMATTVRILFDSGSQRSYLSRRLMDQLQLEPTGGQTVSIATFGAAQERTQVCPIVFVGIGLKGYPNAFLSLHVVPTICEPISSQPITASAESHAHLLKLDLADSADGASCLPVDILVGCDYYWELVTGGICRGEQGPTAIHTKLGWVLSGPMQSRSESED